MVDNEVISLFRRTLKIISDVTQETVGLSVLDGLQTVYVPQVKGDQRVNVLSSCCERLEKPFFPI